MRVIAGEFRSRKLKSIPGDATRPTPDRLREALFNILQTRIEGATFLDAYAGTGAVAIEALSRGAKHAYLLERARPALEAIRENLVALHLESRATVIPGPVLKTIAQQKADIVFLDPPYSLEREYTAILQTLGEAPPPLVIVQHTIHRKLDERYGDLKRTRHLRQSDNALTFYAPEAPPGVD